LGWSGDYYTSSDVHPVLARALAAQVRQMDALLNRPDPFVMVEMGAGKGIFARDFLAACERLDDSLSRRLRYVIVERSPAMQASQRRHLAPWLRDQGRVCWLSHLSQMDTDTVVGALFSNELIDAFPVHRVTMRDGALHEVYVGYDGGRFDERLRPIADPDLDDHLRRLSAMGISFEEGAYAELNLDAIGWIKDVARVLNRGFVVTIDYGHAAADLYAPERRRGTLLCYYHHTASEDPYDRVGLQDMTAHVDFTSLAAVGEAEGLRLTGFTNQMSLLVGLGVEQMLDSLEPGSAEFQSIVRLLRPEGMGRTFKVLIQHKGLESPQLDGLRFKPFFGSVLASNPLSVNRSS
jgi:SAM-dependent MidA family methyltransferase